MASDKSKEPQRTFRRNDTSGDAYISLRQQEGQTEMLNTGGYGDQLLQAMYGYAQPAANYGSQVMQSMYNYSRPASIQTKTASISNQKRALPVIQPVKSQKLSEQTTDEKETIELPAGGMLQRRLTIGAPNDPYEQEADVMADQVMRMIDHPVYAPEISSFGTGKPLQRMCHTCKEETQVKRAAIPGGETQASDQLASRLQAQRGQGSPLAPAVQAQMEQSFGTDFSPVRIHTDTEAVQLSQDIHAQAFTHGTDIYFNQGKYNPESNSGKRLLAHELTHTVQQASVNRYVQRYESGEHAQLGETQAELTANFTPTNYIVQKGEQINIISNKFGITVAELKEANKDKLKKWPAIDGSGRIVEGFDTGENISIPQRLNDFGKAVTKDKSATFTVNGVVMDYGVGIAMGDFFESPDQMAKASPAELKTLEVLIKREQTGGKAVTTEEWQKATNGRYLQLAEKNVTHFAPQNAAIANLSAAGATSPNHRSEWEKHHAAALEASKSGDKDKALMINAFADHFLTDAFAAGHLINKTDVMEQFKSQLKLDDKGEEFIKESLKFFDAVAKDAFTGGVQTEFSKYESFESYKVKGKHTGWHPNINDASRFSILLQGVHKERPDLIGNAVAKGVHDSLNTLPGGLPVENAKGDPPWNLSGDGTLNRDTSNVARKAVAQSQLNVISVYNLNGPSDTPALFKKVWDYTPRPSAAGMKQLIEQVKKGTDVNNADLQKAIVNLIKANYLVIIDELVKLKKLRKA